GFSLARTGRMGIVCPRLAPAITRNPLQEAVAMSKTLTLIHAGWASVESLARAGRRQDALSRVTGLLTRSDLPATLAADAHRLAGGPLIQAQQDAKARPPPPAAPGPPPT